MRRRKFCFVAGASAGLLAGTGCLGTLSEDGLALGGVALGNLRERPVDVRLRVARDGTTVLDETHSLPAFGSGEDTGVFRNDAWNPRAAVYEVSVDVSGGLTDSYAYTEANSDGDCTIAFANVREATVGFGTIEDDDYPCEPTGPSTAATSTASTTAEASTEDARTD